MGNSSSISNSSSSSADDQEVLDTSPDYNTTQLSKLAFLLTGSEELKTQVQQDLTCDKDSGPFVDMMNTIISDPPTYNSSDPLSDIKMVLNQLATCQKSSLSGSPSLLERIGDFFLRKDEGKAIRHLLLLAKILIECLSLWYVFMSNNLLTDEDEVNQLRNFMKDSLLAKSVSAVSFPLIDADKMQEVRNWNGDMEILSETFGLPSSSGNITPPILLIFNDQALESVMRQRDDQKQSSSYLNTVPVTFVPEDRLRKFAEKYLQSGNMSSEADR